MPAHARYRDALPQLDGRPMLTDGGLETTLIFHDGLELPLFAAFTLLDDADGRARLLDYYRRYARIAADNGAGFVLESPTWRANGDWARQLGYDGERLAAANRDAILLMEQVRAEFETPDAPYVISGNLGPRGDGYVPGKQMSAAEARDYHAAQVEAFAGTAADLVTAVTINYADEAVGIVMAARGHGMPVAISFTVETDGRLATGDSLGDAIARTDDATGGYAAYYMINCAHPAHFAGVLHGTGSWRERIRGLRANASRRSHAELDESPDLDDGDPEELASEYRELRELLPGLTVMGGCCGTDHRHVERIAAHCL